ncbi:MAG: hypothetical protein H0W11_03625 [Gemmatimonadetes bacterium]|nr:hypothetical protein [Gemmatimonadota bacterium]
MEALLSWPPLLWTARALLLVLLVSAGIVTALFMVRFFRPTNLRALLLADLPSLASFSASLKVLGQELSANASLDTKRDQQIRALEERLRDVEATTEELRLALESFSEALLRREGSDEE